MNPVLARPILAAGLAFSSSMTLSAQELPGQAWLVVSIGGEAQAAQPPATFRFEADGRVSGSTGCNRFMASYTLEGARLRFSQAAGTRMACPAGLMAQEQRFLAALDEVTRVETAAQGAVILAGDKGELFRLVPLR
ncbi:MAG: META domain-containing protein [Rhabdaerophilum sp.]